MFFLIANVIENAGHVRSWSKSVMEGAGWSDL
jgi:hypothetical protein